MSHFNIAVITKGKPTEAKIAELLAPYDENLEVPHTVTKSQIIAEGKEQIDNRKPIYDEYLKSPEKFAQEHSSYQVEYYSKDFPRELGYTDEEIYNKQIKYYEGDKILSNGDVISTYNPNSKWDWYDVGGRFSGMLETLNGKCNYARIKDVINLTDKKEGAKARRFWELYVDGEPPVTEDDKEILGRFHFYRKEYYIEHYKTKENYERYCSTFLTYAAITKDGTWHQQGEMGWWGMSSGDDEMGWCDRYRELIFDDAEDDDYITIIDCHI